jgi:hypothetical protein
MKALVSVVLKEREVTISPDADANILVLPPYSTLLNEKIIVPSSSTPYFAVEQHFFFNYMKAVVHRIYVDEEWYLARYPDVKDAIDKRRALSAKEHYSRFGYYEHRLPHPISVDTSWYLETYPDVHDSIRRQTFVSATNHFEMVGYKEGRLPYAGFQLQLVGPTDLSTK